MSQENEFKVKIDAYESDPTHGGGGSFKTWEANINPESIKREYEVKWNMDYSANNTGRYIKQYQGQGEELLTAMFVLDATGSIDGVTSIIEKLDDLKECVYGYKGSIHKIPWLKVTLGKDEGFYCHLKTMDITYTKYKPDGEPQRAEINLTFTHHVHPKAMANAANRNSPDMSHLINIKDGDRLTLICDNIYSDFSYYTDIAKANNLTNFRNLEAGAKLVFPPLTS